ncbi:MAG: GNAT family N-acetyltransferase [Myxococcota bacterium]
MKRPFDICPFDPAVHRQGALRLWAAVAGFEGAVPARSERELDTLLADPACQGTMRWRVCLASNDAVVGLLALRSIGSRRAQLELMVNPTWRRQGIARSLLAAVPHGRRLLVQSSATSEAATAFLRAHGFEERHRELRLRAPRGQVPAVTLPKWAELIEDKAREVGRYEVMATKALKEREGFDAGAGAALLSREGTRVFYLRTPQGDQGVCVVTPQRRARKSERSGDGKPRVGLLEQVGLVRECRGKGLSLPLIRRGMQALLEDGYDEWEVMADGRRPQARSLYEAEGFVVHEEDVHWMRNEDESVS